MGLHVRFAIVAVLVAAFIAPRAFADAPASSLPVPPCNSDPFPPYASLGELTVPQTWTSIDWQPPGCLDAWAPRYKFVIALAGHIAAADRNELLVRLGSISKMRGLQYYSVTESAWRVLIKDASALSDADPKHSRTDFTAEEVASGANLFFVEEDNRSSHPVVYRMRATHADAGRIVIETENISPVKSFFVTLFPPGSLRAAYILTRLKSADWGLYVVSASSEDASSLVTLAKSSYENRAQALFQFVASGTGER
jgi:hypothetical protein